MKTEIVAHTRGPWLINGFMRTHIDTPKGSPIATVADDSEESLANATLIAALPVMKDELEAYEEIIERYKAGGFDAVELFDELMEVYKNRSALSKAIRWKK